MPLETQHPAAHRGPILQCLRHGCMLLLRQCLQLLQSSHTSLFQETKLDRSSTEAHIALVIIIVLMNTYFSNSDTCAYLTQILQIPRLPFGVLESLVSSPFRYLKWLMCLNHLPTQPTQGSTELCGYCDATQDLPQLIYIAPLNLPPIWQVTFFPCLFCILSLQDKHFCFQGKKQFAVLYSRFIVNKPLL